MMGTFQEMVAKDCREIFLDLEVFGEQHTIDGREITAILDEDALKKRPDAQSFGVSQATLMLYAAVEDLPERRAAGEGLNVDGREYIIADWSEDLGIGTIALCQSILM